MSLDEQLAARESTWKGVGTMIIKEVNRLGVLIKNLTDEQQLISKAVGTANKNIATLQNTHDFNVRIAALEVNCRAASEVALGVKRLLEDQETLSKKSSK